MKKNPSPLFEPGMSEETEKRHATRTPGIPAHRDEAGAWQAQRWLFVVDADRDHGDFLIVHKDALNTSKANNLHRDEVRHLHIITFRDVWFFQCRSRSSRGVKCRLIL